MTTDSGHLATFVREQVVGPAQALESVFSEFYTAVGFVFIKLSSFHLNLKIQFRLAMFACSAVRIISFESSFFPLKLVFLLHNFPITVSRLALK